MLKKSCFRERRIDINLSRKASARVDNASGIRILDNPNAAGEGPFRRQMPA